MTATLRLIPISREECRSRLEQKGKTSLADPKWLLPLSSPATSLEDEFGRPRHPLALKLCANTDDIIEIDDEEEHASIEHEIVKYASRYQDGSVAAIVALGRNYTTGIKWTAVSRALCDVSLSKSSSSSSGGGKKDVCMVDLAASPAGPNAKAVAASSSSASSESEDQKPQSSNDDKVTIADASLSMSKPQSSNDDKATIAAASLSMRKPQSSNDDEATIAAASLGMRKPAGKHGVYLNGALINAPLGREVPLENGSILSLYGPTGFAYEVILSQNDRNNVAPDICHSVNPKKRAPDICHSANPKKRKANPLSEMKETPQEENEHQKIRERAHELMVGEFTCAMCMDILIKSTFAVPCGHAFCEGCSHNVTNSNHKCPTCRGKVKQWMPARSFDTVVWSAALMGKFDRDDAEFYLERREQCGEGVPTPHERDCILNTVGAGNGGMKNEMLMQPATVSITTLPPLYASSSNIHPLYASSSNSHPYINNALQNPGKRKSPSDVICID